MKPSEVYTRAAELIASGVTKCCCLSIRKIENRIFVTKLEHDFVLYFKPEGADYHGYWMGDYNTENQRARELALYLMAEIAKDFE